MDREFFVDTNSYNNETIDAKSSYDDRMPEEITIEELCNESFGGWVES